MRKIIIFIIILLFSACNKEEYELLSPQLEIIVTDINTNNISEVSVRIFLTQDDWEQHINCIDSGYTNESGCMLFKNLSEEVYFISAVKEHQNNYNDIVSFENPLKKGEKRIIKTIIQ